MHVLEVIAIPNCDNTIPIRFVDGSGYGIRCPDYRGEFIHQLDKTLVS